MFQFDNPLDIDCSRCGADLDEGCRNEGQLIAGFHVERLNAIRCWNKFFATGSFDVTPRIHLVEKDRHDD